MKPNKKHLIKHKDFTVFDLLHTIVKGTQIKIISNNRDEEDHALCSDDYERTVDLVVATGELKLNVFVK